MVQVKGRRGWKVDMDWFLGVMEKTVGRWGRCGDRSLMVGLKR
jgi:hypothetical protein